MIALRLCFNRFLLRAAFANLFAFTAVVVTDRAQAINITVDYSYDNGEIRFFNTQQKKDALQAAANRYSAIITTSLSAAALADDNVDPRIGFKHPTTGDDFEVSAASSLATDALGTMSGACPSCHPADEYRGPWSLAADQWILYAGGRSLPAGQGALGGTGTGLNVASVYTSTSSHLNRGFRLSGSAMNLPVWGGSIAFDNDGSTTWHFDPATAAPAGSTDFYTFALHEIGHALGLNIGFTEWNSKTVSGQFTGTNSVAAYNADNGTTRSSLILQSATDRHWRNNTYDSLIFQNASPNFVGTVGSGALQDLLMEPNIGFTQSVRRFELTNVEVAALRDVGWTTIPQLNLQPGDFNGNGAVDAADYVSLRKGLANGSFATWNANFGESLLASLTANSSHVPEPPPIAFLAVAVVAISASRRKKAYSRG